MNTISISSFFSNTIQSVGTSNASAGGRVDRDGDNDGGGRAQGSRRGGGQMINAIAQTLSQLGIGTISPSAVPPATTTQAAGGVSDATNAANGQNVGQVLQGFMHALFQALGSAGSQAQGQTPKGADADGDNDGSNASGNTVNGAKGYGGLVSKLQNLIQSLSAGTATSSSGGGAGSTSDLNSAFQSLEKALQTGNGASNAPDLQTFLKTLVQNLQSSGSSTLASTANIVNTTA
ncbi:MAG: hypothetical protein NT159_12835 [Proteobacteria bacterium]|nr:hypothetical protein [Pseudomonadota bacterium]